MLGAITSQYPLTLRILIKKIAKYSSSSIMKVKRFPFFSSSLPQYFPKHAPLILQGAGIKRAGIGWLETPIFTLLLIKEISLNYLNKILNDILKFLSGVPKDLILGPILFNISRNDLLAHIKSANTHNYADDMFLSAYSIQ